jgi:hypothetical protein
MDQMIAENILKAHIALTEKDNHQDYLDAHQRLLKEISDLKYPDDKIKIANLSLEWKQWWWLTANKVGFTEIASKNFDRFWYWHYLFPTRIKRISLYLLKPYLLLKRFKNRNSKAEQDLLKRIQERNKERSKVL